MKNLPEKIYLNLGDSIEPDTDYSELSGVTFCQDRINKTDPEYTLNRYRLENSVWKFLSWKDLVDRGYKEVRDETDDPRGVSWEKKSRSFIISVDAWGDVDLFRLDDDGQGYHPIRLNMNDLSDLQAAEDWIEDEEAGDTLLPEMKAS